MHDPGYPLPGLPDGYEAVAIRPARPGDSYLDSQRNVQTTGLKGCACVLIVRKIWQWPDWIKPGHWIAMDSGGQWYLYDKKPVLGQVMFRTDRCRSAPLQLLDWTPPPCSYWRKSAMQKPVEVE